MVFSSRREHSVCICSRDDHEVCHVICATLLGIGYTFGQDSISMSDVCVLYCLIQGAGSLMLK
jgi:hypothetical protein